MVAIAIPIRVQDFVRKQPSFGIIGNTDSRKYLRNVNFLGSYFVVFQINNLPLGSIANKEHFVASGRNCGEVKILGVENRLGGAILPK